MDANNKITPYDSELLLMIESLTGYKPIIELQEGYYTIEVRGIDALSDEVRNAIADAIAGRLGDRMISVYEGKGSLFYTVRYGEDCGELICSEQFGPGDISDSDVFYIPETALRGLMVLPSNFDRLVRFVGNGSWERRPDGNNVFHFLNASGTVFCDAPEGSYLVYVKPGLYRVAIKEEMSKFAMM